MSTSFDVSEGGHAPGILRGAFDDMAELGDVVDGTLYDGAPLTAERLSRLLWDCTDTMPRVQCSLLDMPEGSTYAQAVREYRMVWREGAEAA
jgi:hypothetical protein